MKKQLFSNLGIKLSSLALALVLWFSLYGGREGLSFFRGGRREIVVPVKVLGFPLYPLQVKVTPNTITLVLTGPRRTLKGLTDRNVVPFVLVEGLKKGEYERSPRVYLPEGTKGVKISSRKPEIIKVILDDRWTRKKPLPESLLKKEK